MCTCEGPECVENTTATDDLSTDAPVVTTASVPHTGILLVVPTDTDAHVCMLTTCDLLESMSKLHIYNITTIFN